MSKRVFFDGERLECVTCHNVKSVEEFHKQPDRWTGRKPRCKACRKELEKYNPAYHTTYAAMHKAQIAKKNKAWWENKKSQGDYSEFISRTNYKKRYGLFVEDVEARKKQQDGKCAICREKKDRLCVDHHHESGVFRGLLCVPCNAGIGNFQDSIEYLTHAIEYLQAFQRQQATADEESTV